ncbi:MAG: hypothetical protein H2056_05430 [Sphingopyxis sp.]|nr:hypothetical protein [Sphingopyxis sp.]
MTENVSNELLYEVLKRIQQDVSDIKGDISHLQTRATAVDEHIGGLFITVSGNNNRLDKVAERLERIEKRLDLTDAK